MDKSVICIGILVLAILAATFSYLLGKSPFYDVDNGDETSSDDDLYPYATYVVDNSPYYWYNPYWWWGGWWGGRRPVPRSGGAWRGGNKWNPFGRGGYHTPVRGGGRGGPRGGFRGGRGGRGGGGRGRGG